MFMCVEYFRLVVGLIVFYFYEGVFGVGKDGLVFL